MDEHCDSDANGSDDECDKFVTKMGCATVSLKDTKHAEDKNKTLVFLSNSGPRRS